MPLEGELNVGGAPAGMGLRMKNPNLMQKQPEMYDLTG